MQSQNSAAAEGTARMPHFDQLLSQIALTHPALRDTAQKLEISWSSGDARDLELSDLLASCIQDCVAAGMFPLSGVLDAFDSFSKDFFERQVDYLRSGEYRAKDYSEVVKAVYSDPAYMCTVYYPALVLSYLCAPNYRYIFRQLDSATAGWRDLGCRRVLDLAGGHGLLLLHTLHQLPEAVGIEVDLSASAQTFSQRLQQVTGWGEGRFECQVRDFFDADPSLVEPFDVAICCELLEHLPEPRRALQALHAHLRPGGRLFVTAAIRMESIDHLTLFKTTSEVAGLLDAAGFDVLADHSVPFVLNRPSSPERWQRQLADSTMPATFVAECRRR